MRVLPALSVLAVSGVVLSCGGPASSQEHPDAVTADPEHYSVEFENDVVRILRIQYAPGDESVMHRHPANCAVFLNDQTATFELPNDSTIEATAEAGEVTCWDAEAHRPTNTGQDSLKVILVEFKGREMIGGQ